MPKNNLIGFFNSTNLTIIILLGFDMYKTGFWAFINPYYLPYPWTFIKVSEMFTLISDLAFQAILHGPLRLVALCLYHSSCPELGSGSQGTCE